MKVLILESISKDVEKLKELVLKHCTGVPEFDVVDSFENMNNLYSRNLHDVLFLNIDKNTKDVFKFVESEHSTDSVIFITSLESNLIIEAFKHQIEGYLTKPFDSEQFAQVIERTKKSGLICHPTEAEKYSHFKKFIESGQVNKIALTTLDGYVIVHYDDIIRCEANGNYTSVYFHDGSFLMLTKTLKHYASILEEQGFFRVHKTHLVNLTYVRSYVKGKNSYIELTDGSNIEVSLRKKQALVEMLSN